MTIQSMMRAIPVFILIFFTAPAAQAQKTESSKVDICIYGGTSAGVIAAYSARKMGKTVLLIEPGRNLGGLSSGGLGFTDIGNKYVVTGLAKDFYRKVGSHYGQLEQWVFEPHVAENIFKDYVHKGDVNVLYEYRLREVNKEAGAIKSVRLEPSGKPAAGPDKTIEAKVFIDCSYEGDLMAKAGVSYTVGREANSKYNETYNGVQLLEGHQFPDHIDPYRIPGDSSSGLIWGINSGTLQPKGTGDHKVQAYNYRICLTNNPINRVTITRPPDYDSTRYELLARLIKARKDKLKLDDYFIWSEMPNQKTDINNRNGFSTDMIGTNHLYPDGSYALREEYVSSLKGYTQGLLYFFGHDERVPAIIRQQMLQWGYPKDEYKENNNWSFQPYIREARRMIGEYVMTQGNCTGERIAADGIAMAAYNMDSHNCDRLVINHMVKNEGNVEIPGIPPYPIAYKAILPKAAEINNLLVPVCLSASHIAFGSIRMEPIFMVLGQVAAVAASIAIDQDVSVQKVSYLEINRILTKNPMLDGSTPELIVDNNAKTLKVEGNWLLKVGHAYGPNAFYFDYKNKSNAGVTFYAPDLKPGEYEVYSYYPTLPGGSDKTLVQIFDGKETHEHTILKSKVKVVGQTSGEWVPLGNYHFSAQKIPSVRISPERSNGITIADAILFKPVNK